MVERRVRSDPTATGEPRNELLENADLAMRERAFQNAYSQALIDREKYIGIVQKAAARNPQIDKAVFEQIIAAQDAEFLAHIEMVRNVAETPHAKPVRDELLRNWQSERSARVQARIAPLGTAGAEAMKAINREVQPESFATPIISQVYNSDRGGVQIGGLIGGLALGGLGYFLAGNSGVGGIMKFAVAGLAGLVGTFAGNTLFPGKDTLPTVNLRTDPPKIPGLERYRGPTRPPEKHVSQLPTLSDDLRAKVEATDLAKNVIKPDAILPAEKGTIKLPQTLTEGRGSDEPALT